ncbi:MAG: AfsR/SARP family transcriptional regulator, partial [Gemmatimonadales bacterium]
MIDIRLMGSVDLVSADRPQVQLVMRRSKRLALVAYLAAARPHGFHRRDALLALFWPDLDASHARNALRQAVHFLRDALGHDALLARGDDLALDPRHVRSDVAEFERRVAAGDFESALVLYRGAFLHGLHVSRAPEFEHWLDQERERLRRQAVEVALALAERDETAGRPLDAVRWATRAVEFGPFDEQAVRCLIRALDRSGDRSAAVHAYEQFAERLRRTLELEPAPETRVLVASVRDRETAVPHAARAPAVADTPAGSPRG